MKSATLPFCAMLLLPIVCHSAEPGSAEDMYEACAEMGKPIVKDGRNYLPFTPKSRYCEGAFRTIQANVYLFGSRGLGVCVSQPVSFPDLATTFMAYYSKNIDRKGHSYFLVAMDALREKHPCQVVGGG